MIDVALVHAFIGTWQNQCRSFVVTHTLPQGRMEKISREVHGEAPDVARAMATLTRDESSIVTGAMFSVNGGQLTG